MFSFYATLWENFQVTYDTYFTVLLNGIIIDI